MKKIIKLCRNMKNRNVSKNIYILKGFYNNKKIYKHDCNWP